MMFVMAAVRRCLFAHPLRVQASNYSVSTFSANLQGWWKPKTTHRYGWSTVAIARKTMGVVESNVVAPFQVRSFSLSPALSGLIEKGMGLLVKKTEETMKPPEGIKILASKPHHAYQERRKEIDEIRARFGELKSRCEGESVVVGVYIKGAPGTGKTQLAREFGEQYYSELLNSRKYGGTAGKTPVVARLDARTPDSFLRSYLRLAEDLGFPVNRYNAMSSKIQERVAIISIDVRKKLAEAAPDWLLIVDGIDPGCYARFHPSLPLAGNNDWGDGRILVTTRYDRIIPSDHNRYASLYPIHAMSEKGAISLLHRVSGFKNDIDGAEAVVNSHYVGRVPLDVVSAGIHIKNLEEKDPSFTFSKYLENIEENINVEDEVAQKHDMVSGGYPYSTTFFAVAEAARQLAKFDKWLEKVFTILALCSHEPLPISTFERFVKEEADAGAKMQALKDCGLLMHIPEKGGELTDSYDGVERVYFHKSTHKGFMSKFIGGDHKSDGVKEHQELVKRFAACLLEENENANTTKNPLWTRMLLLPHLEQFHQVFKAHSFDRSLQIQLSVALSNTYIDLSRNPKRAWGVLDDLLAELKKEQAHGHDGVELKPALYRHAGQEMGSTRLMKAQDGKSHLKGVELENALRLQELSATVSSYGEYTQSRLQLLTTNSTNLTDSVRQELISREGIQPNHSTLVATENLPAAHTDLDVFISYKWENEVTDFVDALATEFKERDIRYWKDDCQMSGGEVITDQIVNGINKCAIFVPILSEGYVSEEGYRWCQRECRMAVYKDKIIVPVQWGNTKIPDEVAFDLLDLLVIIYDPGSDPAVHKQKLKEICDAVQKKLSK